MPRTFPLSAGVVATRKCNFLRHFPLLLDARKTPKNASRAHTHAKSTRSERKSMCAELCVCECVRVWPKLKSKCVLRKMKIAIREKRALERDNKWHCKSIALHTFRPPRRGRHTRPGVIIIITRRNCWPATCPSVCPFLRAACPFLSLPLSVSLCRYCCLCLLWNNYKGQVIWRCNLTPWL